MRYIVSPFVRSESSLDGVIQGVSVIKDIQAPGNGRDRDVNRSSRPPTKPCREHETLTLEHRPRSPFVHILWTDSSLKPLLHPPVHFSIFVLRILSFNGVLSVRGKHLFSLMPRKCAPLLAARSLLATQPHRAPA